LSNFSIKTKKHSSCSDLFCGKAMSLENQIDIASRTNPVRCLEERHKVVLCNSHLILNARCFRTLPSKKGKGIGIIMTMIARQIKQLKSSIRLHL
jgi:hypothetical protein